MLNQLGNVLDLMDQSQSGKTNPWESPPAFHTQQTLFETPIVFFCSQWYNVDVHINPSAGRSPAGFHAFGFMWTFLYNLCITTFPAENRFYFYAIYFKKHCINQ